MTQTNSTRFPISTKLLARFFSKIEIISNISFKGVPCWLWTAYLGKGGYGEICTGKHQQKIAAYRMSYEMFVGPIPKGLEPDHLCRIRRCVNPVHLEAVTRRENLIRGNTLAADNAQKTHCKRGHEFTPENTYIAITPTKLPARRCRECMRLYMLLRRHNGIIPEHLIHLMRPRSR